MGRGILAIVLFLPVSPHARAAGDAAGAPPFSSHKVDRVQTRAGGKDAEALVLRFPAISRSFHLNERAATIGSRAFGDANGDKSVFCDLSPDTLSVDQAGRNHCVVRFSTYARGSGAWQTSFAFILGWDGNEIVVLFEDEIERGNGSIGVQAIGDGPLASIWREIAPGNNRRAALRRGQDAARAPAGFYDVRLVEAWICSLGLNSMELLAKSTLLVPGPSGWSLGEMKAFIDGNGPAAEAFRALAHLTEESLAAENPAVDFTQRIMGPVRASPIGGDGRYTAISADISRPFAARAKYQWSARSGP